MHKSVAKSSVPDVYHIIIITTYFLFVFFFSLTYLIVLFCSHVICVPAAQNQS